VSRKAFLLIIALVASCGIVVCAASDGQKGDPSQWNSNDVYQILNNSPWSKTVKTTVASSKDQLGDQSGGGAASPNGGTWGNSGQMPGTGGMGRRGGYSGNRTYGGTPSGTTKPDTSSRQGPTEVTIQWQSALPVQIAAAKKAAGDNVNVDLTNIKPLDNYVIAVIGLPMRALGGRAASVDSDQTTDEEEVKNIEERLKSSTELVCGGRETLHVSKVELNQGADGRVLLYFPKTEPITPSDKTAEFRLVAGRTEIRKKFVLKDMEYQGKLEL